MYVLSQATQLLPMDENVNVGLNDATPRTGVVSYSANPLQSVRILNIINIIGLSNDHLVATIPIPVFTSENLLSPNTSFARRANALDFPFAIRRRITDGTWSL